MADTAALVVALSAQLTKFEKDMKGAVDIASRRTKEIESTFAKMNAEINSQVSGLQQTGLGQLGGVGSIIGKLGPVAATVGAALGGLAIGFAAVSEKVKEFIQQAGQLRDAADTTGLTIVQLKELSKIGLQVGVSAETTEVAITKMTVAVDQLRDGAGPLWEVLKKIDPALLAQVGSAKNAAQAIDILARTFKNLGSEFEKNAFTRQIFGRTPGVGRLLQEVADRGGLQQVVDVQFNALIKQVDDLDDHLKEIQKRTSDLWGKAFAVDVLNAQIAAALAMERIAKAVADIWAQGKNEAPPKSLLMWLLTGGGRTTVGNLGAKPTFAERFGATADRPLTQLTQMPPERPPPTSLTLEQEIKKMEEWIAAMGNAVSEEEKLWLQELKLQKAVKDRTITDTEATRVREAATLQQTVTNAQLRERLGIATEQQIVEGKLAQIQLDSKNITLSSTEAIKAETIARKEAKEAADALAVRTSNLPQLTRFAIDAADQFKQFDQVAISTFGNFENAIASVANGTTKLQDAFKNMANSIIADLVRITLRMSVTGPLASALAGAFGAPGAGAGGNLFSGLFSRQSGGPVRAGSPYVVGEHGPELFVPKSSGQIVPSSVSKGTMAGGYQVVVNNYTAGDTQTKQSQQQGPNGEQLIIDIVKRNMAAGKFDDVNRGRFGLRAVKAR